MNGVMTNGHGKLIPFARKLSGKRLAQETVPEFDAARVAFGRDPFDLANAIQAEIEDHMRQVREVLHKEEQ